MTLADSWLAPAGRQATALALVLMIQMLAAVFFVGDVLADVVDGQSDGHVIFESLVTLALVLGIALGLVALRSVLAQMRRQENALAAAQGALAEVIGRQFADWGLTGAERDVGMLALKGLDVAEIAALRGSAPGTVRAQLTRVYAKAGVSGRAQFAAFFVEDLLGDGVG